MPTRHAVLFLLAAALAPASALAQVPAPKPDPAEVARAVDLEFQNLWRSHRIRPSKPCTDADFLRRASLDLVGTIPTGESVDPFLSEKDGEVKKRHRLVAEFVASPAFGRQQSITWSNALLGYPAEIQLLAQAPFRDWLATEINKGTGFDAITRQILTATGTPAKNPAAVWTIGHEGRPEDLARDASRHFLGVRILAISAIPPHHVER